MALSNTMRQFLCIRSDGKRMRGGSQPISRVLSRTIIHLRRVSPHDCSDLPGNCADHTLAFPYLVLLRVGFTLPLLLPATRCALTAPFHPCRSTRDLGGMFSVALSVSSRFPGVTWHPVLRSPDFPPHNCGDCLANSRFIVLPFST